MTDEITQIRQGASLPFSFSRGSESIVGWTCEIFVKKLPTDTPLVQRFITPTDGVWKGYLTQSETSVLTPGTYRLIAVRKNLTTDEEESSAVRFHVGEAWA